MRNGSALTGFEPALRFVDHVNAALATHNAAITVPVLERAERIANFHVLILPSVAPPYLLRQGPAPGYGRPRHPYRKGLGPVNFVVGDTGIEPVTPSMSTKCSTAELIALPSTGHSNFIRPKDKRRGVSRVSGVSYKSNPAGFQGLLEHSLFGLLYLYERNGNGETQLPAFTAGNSTNKRGFCGPT